MRVNRNAAEQYAEVLGGQDFKEFGEWYQLFFRGHQVNMVSLYEAWTYVRRVERGEP